MKTIYSATTETYWLTSTSLTTGTALAYGATDASDCANQLMTQKYVPDAVGAAYHFKGTGRQGTCYFLTNFQDIRQKDTYKDWTTFIKTDKTRFIPSTLTSSIAGEAAYAAKDVNDCANQLMTQTHVSNAVGAAYHDKGAAQNPCYFSHKASKQLIYGRSWPCG